MLCETHSVSSRIWTRVAVSISYDDNQYTTGIYTHEQLNFTSTLTTTSIYTQTISKYIYDTFNSERKREKTKKTRIYME